MISNIYAVGHAPRSPHGAEAMSMTRVECGQSGGAVNLWLSSQHPKKAETAPLPKKQTHTFWDTAAQSQNPCLFGFD